ncbi:P-loop containing nucleoside triphosphate hydrolase protein [Lipomyces arxii]|uniref:P-loop containing nucleoside triphosphate hydrolase protein n=1 Tax=Lipomyces arxii TaxID=56418 RepID=UPI0034CF4FEE
MGRKGFVTTKDFDTAQRLTKLDNEKKSGSSWSDYAKYFWRFFPYVWPYKDRGLQLKIVLCMLIVAAQRAVNILVPHQLGKVTDALSGEIGTVVVPWPQICLYLVLRYLQGSGSVLGFLQSRMWMHVSQYAYRSICVLGFEHVLGLGLDYHLSMRTSEIMSTLDKGHAITSFVEKITFQMAPMIIDMSLALGYFIIAFDAYYTTAVVCVAATYVLVSTRLSKRRIATKRLLVQNSIAQWGIKADSIGGYETVKYFNAQDYEMGRYSNALAATQNSELDYHSSNRMVGLVQNGIFTAALFVSCAISAYRVSTGQAKVGSFVSILTYMAQLQHPLDQLTSFLQSTQDNLISAERMIDVLELVPNVQDRKDSKPLQIKGGSIKFDKVAFSYGSADHWALSNITLDCRAGSTVAFVGESGGGKSTIFRLLFRFYDVNVGSIFIDGNDIRDVTLKSLADAIGVVPQECVLFNDTVMFNIRYAKRDATDEEVYAAARAASIHDKILRFPDGYDTKVGEHGLRLSGGERQRIAIARAILKNPPILLLDEATAMLDIDSERHIQAALHKLSSDRTTLVIAHRLSTIMAADKIVVIHEGRVVEQGSHAELLALKGRYCSMWHKQVAPAYAELDDEGNALDEKIVDGKKTGTFLNDLNL